jgi:hypothetical protein
MSRGACKLGLLALVCGILLPPHAAVADALSRPGARLAQRLNPAPVPAPGPAPIPGGLPGVAPAPLPAPAPQAAPSLPAPPLKIAPPPPSLTPKAPDEGGAEGCDCRVEVEVPVYEMGRIVRWQREPRLLGRNPQCCRK